VAELLRRVGLRPEFLRRYPHAFSGGERQRIGIARALALRPSFVVADGRIQRSTFQCALRTLNLLSDLQEEFHLTYLFISHDLSVVQHICDRVAVMSRRQGWSRSRPPKSCISIPSTRIPRRLLSAVPKTDPDRSRGASPSKARCQIPAGRRLAATFIPRLPLRD